MSANPLVAGPVDTATATSGTGLIDDIVGLSTAIREGNWVDAALNGVATVMDGLATAIDPVGSLIAWGIGWVLDHVDPLKSWLNDLTGNAGAIIGFAQTWANVSTRLQEQAQFLSYRASADLSGMYGDAVTAYLGKSQRVTQAVHAVGVASNAVAGGLQLVSTLVQVVHDLVRDTISQVIGSCASALGWAATGVGIPYAITVVSERAAALSAKISAKVTGLVRSVKKLDGLLTKLDNALADLRTALRQLGGGGGGHGAGGAGAPAPHGIGHPNGHQSGGSSRPRTGGYAAEDAWAARRYEDFRTGDRRIDEILDGLGDVKKPDGSAVTQDDINNVYDHLFLSEHPLSDYNGGTYQARFDVDPDIAEAWDRLRAGRPRQSDVLLLQHEIEEHRLMSTNPDMSYADAHHQTNTLFNWQASIAELSN